MPAPWIDLSGHRDWLDEQARRLLDFYLSAADHVAGGFFALGRSGDPVTGLPKREAAPASAINSSSREPTWPGAMC